MSANTFQFDPRMVAHYEVEGWKAYYDRAWLKLLRLIVALVTAQFRIPFPQSWLAAYYITRASIAWVPKDHDEAAIKRALAGFYRLALRYSGLRFDPTRAAEWEFRYWDSHRRLVGSADKSEFLAAMVGLHSEIFGLTADEARESAQLRVEANNVLDTITGRTSPDPARDWLICEDLLQRCYASIEGKLRQNAAKP